MSKYKGTQWEVTDAGIECLDRTYNILAEDLNMTMGEGGWVEHMSEKDWVDLPDFKRAFESAKRLFG